MLMAMLGAAAAIALTCTGSAVGSAYGGQVATVQRASGGSWTAFVPIIMAGVIGIYGLIISVLIVGRIDAAADGLNDEASNRLFAAGLAVGVPGLVSGCSIGVFCRHLLGSLCPAGTGCQADRAAPPGYARVRDGSEPTHARGGVQTSECRDPKQLVDTSVFLVLTFIEALALYGHIVALLLSKTD